MSGACDNFILEDQSCEWFDLVQYVQSFDMGINFLEGPPGPPGPAGEAIFIPAVSEDGWISWTNTSGLPNPDPVYIKGPPGVADYDDLTDKPSINGVTLSGNKTTAELQISFSAADIGAVAEATYITDANIDPGWSGQPALYRWNINTLNTPRSEGISGSFSYGIIICYSSYVSGICVQFALCAGMAHAFCRRQNGGTWTPWSVVANKDDIPTVQSGTVAASVGSDTVKTTSVTFPTPFSSVPSVSVNYGGNVTAAEMAAIGYSVRNVSATGFDLLVGVEGTTPYGSMTFRWQAIGT